ncbi:MAG: hypothetical protein KAG66_07365 [Methylococcales bacterium]|nr:hypothetical protein [Methylococcales bacterium]
MLALLLRFLGRSLLPRVLGHRADMGEQVGDGAHGLGAALPEDQAHVALEVFGVFDEAEAHHGLVPRAQVSLRHLDDGGRLANAAYVHCGPVNQKPMVIQNSLLSGVGFFLS